MEVPLDMGLHRIINLDTPTEEYDGVNKKYVDDIAYSDGIKALFVQKAGDTMLGYLKGLEPVEAQDFATKNYIDTGVAEDIAGKVDRVGDTMTGYLKGLYPVVDDDFATKKYTTDIAEIVDIRQNIIGTLDIDTGEIGPSQTLAMYDVVGETFADYLPLATQAIVLAVRTQNNSSAGKAVCQLDAGGRVPIDLLPYPGVSLQGMWSPAADGPTPPAGSPGFAWIFSEDGDMTLRTGANPAPTTVPVSASDAMVYIEVAEPTERGWYYLVNDQLDSIIASQVVYDNSELLFAGTDVQAVLEEIGKNYINGSGGTISGDLIFEIDKSGVSSTNINATNSNMIRMVSESIRDNLLIGDVANTGNTIITTAERVMFNDKAGTTHTAITPQGNLYLNSVNVNNNASVGGQVAAGDAVWYNIGKIDTGNNTVLGSIESANAYLISGSTITLRVGTKDVLVANSAGVSVAGNVGFEEHLRMSNNKHFTAKNAAGDENFLIAYVDSADNLVLGSNTTAGAVQTILQAGTRVIINGGSGASTFDQDGLDVTGYVSATGNVNTPAVFVSTTAAESPKLVVSTSGASAYLNLQASPNDGGGQDQNAIVMVHNGETRVCHAGLIKLNTLADGVLITGNAVVSTAPTATDHLTNKSYVDSRVVHHATEQGAIDASNVVGDNGLHTCEEGT